MKKFFLPFYSCWASAPQPTRRYGSWTLRPMRSAKRPSLKTNWFSSIYTPPGAAPARRWSAIALEKEVGDFMDEYFVAAKYDIDKPTGKALAGKHGIRSIPTYLVFNTEGDLLGKIIRIHAGRRVYRRPSEDHRRNREEIATGGCNKERKRFLYEDRFRSPFPSCSEYDLTSDYSVSCPKSYLATDGTPAVPGDRYSPSFLGDNFPIQTTPGSN